jgi:hypothetical protein
MSCEQSEVEAANGRYPEEIDHSRTWAYLLVTSGLSGQEVSQPVQVKNSVGRHFAFPNIRSEVVFDSLSVGLGGSSSRDPAVPKR